MKGIQKLGWLCSAVLSLGLLTATAFAEEDAPEVQPVNDAPNVTGVTVNSTDYSNMLEGAYDGTARLVINGIPFEAHSSTSPLTITGPLDLVFREAATITAMRATTFETSVGTLTTVDEIHIQPVPMLGWYFVYGT